MTPATATRTAAASSERAKSAEGESELVSLLAWFEEHGGAISKVQLEDLGGDMNLSLVTTERVARGDVVMYIPISLCMTVESAERSDLASLLSANPGIMNSPDEVLALYLMHERRKGEESFWKEYLRTLPDDVDTPLRWIEEGCEDETRLLDGTMVGVLSGMMSKQVRNDWEEIHLPLIEAQSDLLGGITFQDYLWALSSIWSRAFDYNAEGSDGNTTSCRRAMVPVINAANHHPTAASSLSEMIEFESEGGVANKRGGGSERSPEMTCGALRVRAGRDYHAAGEQFFILYGRYSNAKLLYSYGFALPDNPYGSLDYWVRVPPSDAGFTWKQALLENDSLTAVQGYDFSGTVRSGGWVSPALLATARVAHLIPEERHAAENAFRGKIVSPRNEAAALGTLLVGLKRKLIGSGKLSVSEEADLTASLEDQLQQDVIVSEHIRGITDGAGTETKIVSLMSDAGQLNGDDLGESIQDDGYKTKFKLLQRQIAAARVRLEEKTVIEEAIAGLEVSLQALREASLSEAGLALFRPLDSVS